MRTAYMRFQIIAAAILFLSSCDDIVQVKTGSSASILNVDAWINNKPITQTISLTMTQAYFANDELPSGISGATVSVTDNNGKTYNFIEDTGTNDGSYRWIPAGGEVLGESGLTYMLNVQYNGETFIASAKMGRVPAVDSISFGKDDNSLRGGSRKDFYTAQFWGTDPAGAGDTYWIKTYKNGVLLNKPSEINLAYDASPNKGSQFDGVTFVVRVRTDINADDQDADGKDVSPLAPGDSIYVEMNSLTESSFNYMNEVVIQTDRNGGLSELFTSTPLENVSSNIINTNANGSPVVGFFNVASVSGLGKKFVQ